MSRSGYSDDCDNENGQLAMWRGRIASAVRGKRGQSFFRRLVAALDAIQSKRLIDEELVCEGDVCAIGAVLRDVPDLATIDPENHARLAAEANIAECLVQEVEDENDEGGWQESPEQRWTRMRKWAVDHIKETQ